MCTHVSSNQSITIRTNPRFRQVYIQEGTMQNTIGKIAELKGRSQSLVADSQWRKKFLKTSRLLENNTLTDLISKIYCRCSGNLQCETYQHITSEHHTAYCVLIESVEIKHDQSQTFVSNENQVIYKKGILDSSYIPVEKYSFSVCWIKI